MRTEPYCGLCSDTGMVTVYHPKTTADARHDFGAFLEIGRVYSAGVACGCRYGDRWRNIEGMRTYDRTLDCLWYSPGSTEDCPSLASAARAALEKKPADGESAAVLRKMRLGQWIDEHRGEQYAFNPDAEPVEELT